MSNESLHAFSAGKYDYSQAITMYDREIEENRENSAAYNNRGLCKLHVGSDPYDPTVIRSAIQDFTTALELSEKENIPNESARHNLALALGMMNL